MGYNSPIKKMKKLMILLMGVIVCTTLYARSCTPPEGYSFRQDVAIYTQSGEKWRFNAEVYQATNACDAFCICFTFTAGNSNIYYVSRSDKSGYGYMFWYNGNPYYFNM